jgi:hypothetical protein
VRSNGLRIPGSSACAFGVRIRATDVSVRPASCMLGRAPLQRSYWSASRSSYCVVHRGARLVTPNVRVLPRRAQRVARSERRRSTTRCYSAWAWRRQHPRAQQRARHAPPFAKPWGSGVRPRPNEASSLDLKRKPWPCACRPTWRRAVFGLGEPAGARKPRARTAAHCAEPLQSDGVRRSPQALMVMPLPERADVMRYNVPGNRRALGSACRWRHVRARPR